MPRGNRRYIYAAFGGLAAFAMLILAAQYSYRQFYEPAEQDQATQSYQPARDSTRPPTPHNQRPRGRLYDPHCEQPQSHDDADLCAQWGAVRAMAETNRLTRVALRLGYVGFWVAFMGGLFGIAGTILLWLAWQETRAANRIARRDYGKARLEARKASLLAADELKRARDEARLVRRRTAKTLAETRRSADAHAELTRIAAENGERELRAYLDFDIVEVARDETKDEAKALCAGISVVTRNYGKTPADNVRYLATFFVFETGKPGSAHASKLEEFAREGLGSISPGDNLRSKIMINVEKNLWAEIVADRKRMRVRLVVRYTDAFNNERVLASDYITNGAEKILGFIAGTRQND